ncbi:MAG: polysaccharide biosynthesis/export family protein [Chthoniobacterales bacterium]
MLPSIKVLTVVGLACVSGFALPLKAQDASNYKVSPNDTLSFKVFQEPDLDAVVRIAGDGTAIFPLVGSVNLAGKTVAEATSLLRQRYLNGYLVNPQISLIVTTYSKKTFTMLGQVGRPGTYDIASDQTISLLEAIGMGGGYTRIADPGHITVRRRENGQDQVFHLNGKKANTAGLGAEDFMIKPGDIITVGESIF